MEDTTLKQRDEFLARKVEVFVYENDEAGKILWSVCPEEDSEFWLDAFDSREEAAEFCEANGLPVSGFHEMDAQSKENVLNETSRCDETEEAAV